MEIFLIFLLGVVTSFLSNIAGGGGELIMLPTLLALGVNPLHAIGSGKLGGFGLIIGSNLSSHRKGVVRKDYFKPLLVAVLISSIAGPLIAFNISEQAVKIVIVTLIVIAAVVAIISWHLADHERRVKRWQRRAGYAVYTATTTMLSGFGSGIGLLNTYVLIALLGMSPIQAISTRRYMGLVGLPIQTLPFIISGNIDYQISLALFFGTLIGSYFGLNTAIKQGNVFVKRMMAAVSLLLVASLFI